MNECLERVDDRHIWNPGVLTPQMCNDTKVSPQLKSFFSSSHLRIVYVTSSLRSQESTLYGEWTARIDLARASSEPELPQTLEFLAVCRNVYGEVTSTASVCSTSVNWHKGSTATDPRPHARQLDAIAAEVDVQERRPVVEVNRTRRRSEKADEAYKRRKSESPGTGSKEGEKRSPMAKEKPQKDGVQRVESVEAELPLYEPPKPGTTVMARDPYLS
jgi:hypothetical protein